MSVVARKVKTYRPETGETADSPRHFRSINPMSLNGVKARRLQQLYQQEQDMKSILSSRLKDRSQGSCDRCVERFIPCTTDDGCSTCDWCSLSKNVCIHPGSMPTGNTQIGHLRHYRPDYVDVRRLSEHGGEAVRTTCSPRAVDVSVDRPHDARSLATGGAVVYSGNGCSDQLVGGGYDQGSGDPLEKFRGGDSSSVLDRSSASTVGLPDMQGANYMADYLPANATGHLLRNSVLSENSEAPHTMDLCTQADNRPPDTGGPLSYEDLMEIFGCISPPYGGSWLGSNTLGPGSVSAPSVVSSRTPCSSSIDVTVPTVMPGAERPQHHSHTHNFSFLSEHPANQARVVYDHQIDIDPSRTYAAHYDARWEHSTPSVTQIPEPSVHDSLCMSNICGGWSAQQQSLALISPDNHSPPVPNFYARSGVELGPYNAYSL